MPMAVELVKTTERTYPIYLEQDFSRLPKAMEEAGLTGRTVCIITDSNVDGLYGAQVQEALAPVSKKVHKIFFPAGEMQKNLGSIRHFYEAFFQAGLDRKSVIVALGGGVTGDMAGFAAATFLRGIAFVQIPTTLLAQVDSSVGGKVGVDFDGHKNAVGAFYQPHFVYINAKTLRTLPKREFSAGMAEVIKYGPIWDMDFFSQLEEKKEALLALEEETLLSVIGRCCAIKAEVVGQDEKESGLREILNFGHTIGHAIETASRFSLLHGECVGLGMIAIGSLCEKRGTVEQGFTKRLSQLLEAFSLPLTVSGLTVEEIDRQMAFDKKVKNGAIGFVLLSSAGVPLRTTCVTEEERKEAIAFVLAQ